MKSLTGLSSWLFTLSTTLCLLFAPSALTAEWAEKLFKEKQHDFGTVGRNAKAEHSFVIENCFEDDVHIASVRSSCGCTNPVVPKKTLKSWEKGEVIAQFNTKSFIGDKSASITVVIDRPYYAEVTLMVKGKIRSDIVLAPGEVNFADVDVGESKAIDINISYAGRADWAITDVRGDVDCLEVKLDPAVRQKNLKKYRMNIRLLDNAKVGELQEEITVVTNDTNEPFFRIPVYARVNPPISVTPKFVSVGSVKEGNAIQSKLLIRSKKPFSIEEIVCEDPRFSFETPKGEKPVHIIPIVFRGELKPDEAEDTIKQSVRIKTSLGDDVLLETTFTGKVVH